MDARDAGQGSGEQVHLLQVLHEVLRHEEARSDLSEVRSGSARQPCESAATGISAWASGGGSEGGRAPRASGGTRASRRRRRRRGDLRRGDRSRRRGRGAVANVWSALTVTIAGTPGKSAGSAHTLLVGNRAPRRTDALPSEAGV